MSANDDQLLTSEGGGGGGTDSDDPVYARIGVLEFEDQFSNPEVTVDQSVKTANHELVAGSQSDEDYLVQRIAAEPPTITINGVVTESQLGVVDRLVDRDKVELRSDRWTGEVVPTSISTDDPRMERDGERLFRVTIKCKGISRSFETDR